MNQVVVAAHYYSVKNNEHTLDYGAVTKMAFASGPLWLKKHANKARLWANTYIVYAYF